MINKFLSIKYKTLNNDPQTDEPTFDSNVSTPSSVRRESSSKLRRVLVLVKVITYFKGKICGNNLRYTGFNNGL